MESLVFQFIIESIDVIKFRFALDSADMIKLGLIERTYFVSLLVSSEISINNNIDFSLDGIF